ncbi:MAG: YtxH domain-containing protein [Chromatiales bacterium]|nr:YtxH domain-containing protein [Chromatiales bacterium]
MTRNINGVKGFLIGFLAGGTVGAIIALLTAPKSGKELRGDIKQKSEEYYDEAEKYLADAKTKASELINDAKSKYPRYFKCCRTSIQKCKSKNH